MTTFGQVNFILSQFIEPKIRHHIDPVDFTIYAMNNKPLSLDPRFM